MNGASTQASVPRVAGLPVPGGSVQAWRSPFGRTLHVLVRTRSERGFVRLYDAFDAHELLEGSHVLVGGVLDEEFDGVELVTDVGDRHSPLLFRRGWLALVPSHWTGAFELRLLSGDRVAESHRIEELEGFIDRGWTSYAPLDAH